MGSSTDSLDLGAEIDVGGSYTWKRRRAPAISADLQYGRFMPGSAFLNAEGNKMSPVDRLFAGLTLTW